MKEEQVIITEQRSEAVEPKMLPGRRWRFLLALGCGVVIAISGFFVGTPNTQDIEDQMARGHFRARPSEKPIYAYDRYTENVLKRNKISFLTRIDRTHLFPYALVGRKKQILPPRTEVGWLLEYGPLMGNGGTLHVYSWFGLRICMTEERRFET